MQEILMKLLGLKSYVVGGQAMAERLRESGVENIKVVGRGAVKVSAENNKKMSHYRRLAKRYVEQDAQAVAAGNKESNGE